MELIRWYENPRPRWSMICNLFDLLFLKLPGFSQETISAAATFVYVEMARDSVATVPSILDSRPQRRYTLATRCR
jgi:hypothetical protein